MLMTQLIGNQYPFFAAYGILQFVVARGGRGASSAAMPVYVNFGTSAFFGVGVYTAVFLFKAGRRPPLCRADRGRKHLSAHCSAFAVGLLTLRMQGIFFSIATIALTIVHRDVGDEIGDSSAARAGIPDAAAHRLMAPFPQLRADAVLSFRALLVVLAVCDSRRYIQNSWIGRGLQALKRRRACRPSAPAWPTLRPEGAGRV